MPSAPARSEIAALTPERAREVLDVLRDSKRREDAIAMLEAIASAVPQPAATAPRTAAAAMEESKPAASPAPAPAPATKPATAAPTPAPAATEPVSLTSDSLLGEIIVAASGWFATLSDQLAATGEAISRFPLIWNWLVRTATDPFAQSTVLDAAWRLAAVLASAGLAQWLVRRLLRRPMRAVENRARAQVERRRQARAAGTGEALIASRAELRFVHRIPLALLRLALEAIPIAVFAAVGNSLLATPLSHGALVPLIILAAVNAYVIQHAIMAVGRALVSPGSEELRPFHISDETAAYVEVWLARISGVAIYGIATLEIARLLDLYPAAYSSAVKLVILVNHLLLSIVVLQCRKGVADLIASPAGSTSAFALARNWLAHIWHVLVIFLLLGLWFVWAVEIRNGYSLMLRYSGATIVVLVVARLIAVALLGILDRVFRIRPETARKLPFLEARANRYYPLLRRFVSGLMGVVTVLAVLQVWGVNAIGWFQDGALGERIAVSVMVLLGAALLAIVIWEGTNTWLDRRIARMTSRGEYAHSARLRTLLPLLRSSLFAIIAVIIGFTALSQLGVNIAPLLAGAGIIGVALGFGSQKLVQDVITGIFLLLENTMQVGDWVTVSGLSGTVENLSIRTIRLRAGDGSVHVIPFSSVTTVTNTNRGIGNAAVSVTVAASEDTDRVGEVLKEIGAELRQDPTFRDQILDDFALWGVDKVDGATATVLGQMPCRDTGRWGVQREFNRRIKKRFQELGIEIAVPAQAMILWRPQRPAAEPATAPLLPMPVEATGAEKHSPPPAALGNTQ